MANKPETVLYGALSCLIFSLHHIVELVHTVHVLYMYACHWWFNYTVYSLMLSLPVYQVRLDWLPLPCIALIRPSQLSCLGSSVGRASAS